MTIEDGSQTATFDSEVGTTRPNTAVTELGHSKMLGEPLCLFLQYATCVCRVHMWHVIVAYVFIMCM